MQRMGQAHVVEHFRALSIAPTVKGTQEDKKRQQESTGAEKRQDIFHLDTSPCAFCCKKKRKQKKAEFLLEIENAIWQIIRYGKANGLNQQISQCEDAQ